jgi:hypothetical protein
MPLVTTFGVLSARSFGFAGSPNGSLAFNGTNWVTLASNAALAFGSGDFTVGVWVYLNSVSTTLQILFSSGDSSTNNFFFHLNSGQISVGNKFSIISAQTTTFSTGQWYYVAACRASGTLRLFVNGSQIGSNVSDGTAWLSDGTSSFGGTNLNAAQTVHGNLSNLIVLKGVALYTSNFTPPSKPFVPIAGTQLLACQGSGFADASPNHFTLTPNGAGVTLSSTNPF